MTGSLAIAIVIMLIGLVGSITPVLPGPPIVWLGAFYYAWQTDFQEVGYVTLGILAVLAIAGGTSDLWVGYLGARRGGASGWATLASLIGGIIGLFVFNVIGMIVGSLAGVILVEYLRHGDWQRVWQASRGYLAGWLVGMVIQVVVCVIMFVLFGVAVAV